MGVLADSLKRHFEETPKEVLDKEWEEIKHLNEIGPDVLEYCKRVREYQEKLGEEIFNKEKNVESN